VAAEDKIFGGTQTKKGTNFHTGFLANQKGNVIFSCDKHFMGPVTRTPLFLHPCFSVLCNLSKSLCKNVPVLTSVFLLTYFSQTGLVVYILGIMGLHHHIVILSDNT